jgi:hypothetical protein
VSTSLPEKVSHTTTTTTQIFIFDGFVKNLSEIIARTENCWPFFYSLTLVFYFYHLLFKAY